MYLQSFDYTIEHRPGTKMQHVDALSRRDCVLAVYDPIRERLERAQRHDEKLQAIRSILEDDHTFQNYTLDNGLIFEKKGEQKLLVVPAGMRDEIIRRAHEFGHFGVKKTVEKLQQEFSIDKIEKRVQKVIDCCVPCILGAKKQGKQEGQLNPISKEGGPLHTWHTDHVGPLTSTSKNYKYLLTVIDGFTKYTWIFALKTKSAKETVDKFKILKQHFGSPERLIVDKAFLSDVLQEFCDADGVELHAITTGMPRGNGQVERIHSVIKAIFTKITVDEPNTWYKYLTRVQHAINGSFHRSIATTPHELLFGVKLKVSEDLEIRRLLDEAAREFFIDSRAKLRAAALQQIEKVQRENRKGYNKHRKPATKYRVDDIVAIKRTQLGPGLKLAIKFLGPYRIAKANDNDRYDVERIGDGKGPGSTSTGADFMKPWRGFADDLEPNDYDDDSGVEEGNDDDGANQESE